MGGQRKMFTAELQRMKGQGGGKSAVPDAAARPDNAEVLRAIDELRAELRALTHFVKGDEVEGETPQDIDAQEAIVRQKQAEVSMLKTELRALAVCIEQTKSEIAALRPAETQDDRLIIVASELDAIVNATEQATQQILESAEKIEALASEIQSQGVDTYVSRLADDINETIIGIFEACNFQDITGQRITKVVRTLKYIEDRINAMIEIWGPDNFSGLNQPESDDHHQDADAKLLNGPQLENEGISQDEIDRLFG
jgi:chemotaxis protein CheZ